MKCLTRILIALFALICVPNPSGGEEFPICIPGGAAASPAAQRLAQNLDDYMHGHSLHPLMPRSNPLPRAWSEKPCVDSEHRISFAGFDHCRMHPEYQKFFPQEGCNCSTGQCRPTNFKIVAPTPDNPEGIMIEIDGNYYPMPPSVLHKLHPAMPKPMLEYEAHVCAFPTEVPGHYNIECGWVRIGW